MTLDFSDPSFVVSFSTAVASLAAAVVSVIQAIHASRKAAALSRLLEEAKARETYAVCPCCNKKIPLSELSFHLPDGALDDNLNGVPDVKE